MKMLFVALLASLLHTVSLAQSQPVPQSGTANANPGHASVAGDTATSAAGKISSSAAWQPAPDFVSNAHKACDQAAQAADKGSSSRYGECFIDQMAAAGASPDAVAFSRALYKATDGQVGYMGVFRDFGPIAMAWVVYPLRANDNYAVMFLNGSPNFLDLDDMQKLDKAAMEKDPRFLEYKKTYPKLDVWPADRSGAENYVRFVRTYGLGDTGGLRFLAPYPLLDGCHACARAGFVNYWWDFDTKGKFLGTKLISVGPVPPPMRPLRPKPQAAPPGTPPSPPSSPSPDANPAPNPAPNQSKTN